MKNAFTFYVLTVALLCQISLCADPTFTVLPSFGEGMENGALGVADYDNDGFRDLLMFGIIDGANNPSTRFWKNNGNLTFTNVTNTAFPSLILPAISSGSISWGDFNNDGFVDLFVTSTPAAGYSKLYKNNQNGTFSLVTATAFSLLPVVTQSKSAWGDYDNDGFIDLYFQGSGSLGAISKLYKNNGNETFTDVTTSAFQKLVNLSNGDVAWGDYDRDGFLDLFVQGFNNTRYHSKLYKNNKNETFSDVTDSAFAPGGLIALSSGAIALADYNNDGWIDLWIGGKDYTTGNVHSLLFQNNKNGTFSNVTSTAFPSQLPPGVIDGSVAWGDYNNDTWVDLIITGLGYARLYKNNKNGTFTDVTGTAFPSSILPGTSYCSIAWADFNNDGAIDLALVGLEGTSSGGARLQKIYINSGPGYDGCGVWAGDNSTCIGCDDVLFSGKKYDACGVCDGNNSTCTGCDNVPNSGKKYDGCGICGGNNSTCRGCDGVLFSGKKYDACGVCDGTNSTCWGCDHIPNSGSKYDGCGLCGGTNSTCSGCDGIPYSNATRDECGVCGGNNATCSKPPPPTTITAYFTSTNILTIQTNVFVGQVDVQWVEFFVTPSSLSKKVKVIKGPSKSVRVQTTMTITTHTGVMRVWARTISSNAKSAWISTIIN